MPKKPKIDKRLDKFFKDINPEESDSKSKRSLKVQKEEPPLPVGPKPVQKKSESVSTLKPIKRLASALIPTEPVVTQEVENTTSTYSINIQTGYQDWSTLRVMDDSNQRQWTSEEELLVKQVSDQLSLALENARLFQETRKSASELVTLNEIIRAISEQVELKDVLRTVYEKITELIPVDAFFVALYDEASKLVSYPIVIDEGKTFEEPDSLINPETFSGKTILSGKLLFETVKPEDAVSNVGDDSTLGNAGKSYGTLLFLPLKSGAKTIGCISIQSYDFFAYKQDDVSLLENIANQVSIGIQNAKLYNDAKRTNEELAVLNGLSAELTRLLGISSISETVFKYTSQLMDTRSFFICLLNEEKQEISFPFFVGDSEIMEVPPRKPANGLSDYVMRTNQPLFIPDRSTERMQELGIDTVLVGNSAPTKSWLGVPLSIGNRVLGAIAVQSTHQENLYNEHQRDLLQTIGQQAAVALENARLFQETERSEADLRALFSSMEDVVLVYDRDGRYVRIAPTNPSSLVKPPEELLGKLMHDVLPKETADRFLDAIRQTLDGSETIQLEYDLNVDNETYWFLANLSKLDDNNVFWVARDITERKKSEESIRRRNEYLAASSEIGKIVTSTLDLNTIFARTVNLIIERFSFYHASIFIVEETGFNAVLRESTGDAGAEMKKNKHSLKVNDKSIVGKVALDGLSVVINDAMVDLLHKYNPLLPETRAEAALPLRIGNRTIGVIDIQAKSAGAFTNDEITVLQTVADQVAVAIDNARSFELSQQAVMEMREIDRLKSQFLANMSHELRTPLNSIIGFSRVIIKGIDGPVTELQQQDLTAIYNSGQHLLGLINDILDLSKIEAGKMELAFDEVNIADVTSSVLSTMSGLIKDKPIQIKRIIEPNLPTVRADAIRIRQVMLNLLSNATKFTDEGDIIVEVSLKPGSTRRNEMRISVTDTGPGISKQDQTKLFQPFSQVDDSPTRKTGGTGLGLSICQHIVNMHGGRIWIDSDVGKGSTFHFTLPLFRKEKENEQSTPGGNKVILAIDDDPQVIGLYERYLQPQGYQVVPLYEPSRAVERVKQLKPFAVTLDIMMPGVDGWQVLDSLKGDPETRDTPIIVCSIIEDLEKGFNLGATDYLVKPILEDDLVNALDRLNSDGSIREVLVIDDDPDDLRLIGKILTDDGRYKAILAEGGRVGWDIISSGNPPHAVILDLFMPELDGFKILESMQADQKLRDVPVIVISGMDISAEQKNQLNEFGQRLLSKGSFNEKELLTSIQRSLERVHAKNK